MASGLILKTIQYTRGVIGAAASSTTRAMDLVPGGITDQRIGGLWPAPWQVYCEDMVPCSTIGLVTVMMSGASWRRVTGPPTRPHPLSRQSAPAMTAARARLQAVPARQPTARPYRPKPARPPAVLARR